MSLNYKVEKALMQVKRNPDIYVSSDQEHNTFYAGAMSYTPAPAPTPPPPHQKSNLRLILIKLT